QIRLFGNQSQDPVRVLFQWRNTPAAPFRRRAPCLTPPLAPSNYRTNADLEDLGYLPPRRSAFNRFNRTLTHVRGIRPRHRFSSPANQFPQIRLGDSGWESLRFNADGKCSSCPLDATDQSGRNPRFCPQSMGRSLRPVLSLAGERMNSNSGIGWPASRQPETVSKMIFTEAEGI